MTRPAGGASTAAPRARQRGAALLVALLTVSLVATLAAGALWQQWRGVEIESAERARAQAAWILTGALDWSRLILREDGRSGGPDHLAEPWAVPLQEARLSSFLATDGQSSDPAGEVQDAFLSGSITDLQSRLNVQNLIEGQQAHPATLRAFTKLFELLGLPAAELNALVSALPLANSGQGNAAPLPPQRLEQLRNLGLSPATLRVLRPHVTLLPVRTPVNLNTASAEVLYAIVRGLDMAGAQRLVARRAQHPFKALSDAAQLLGESGQQLNESDHAISSRYFEVRGRLRLDQAALEERSLVYRSGMDTRTLWRERTSLSTPAPAANTP